MIRVLIAEDSITMREFLREVFSAEADVEVVGEARNGVEAVSMTMKLKPDVVVMDIQMPRMDGFEATKKIMKTLPTPIVIVSGTVDVRDVLVTMEALRAGALSALPKPAGPTTPDFESAIQRFVGTVKAMADVKVVRRRRARSEPIVSAARVRPSSGRIIAIAASTGGPPAVHRVLSELPRDFHAPILVVQHMAIGFTPGFADWLNTGSALRVKIAETGERLAAGTVYIAPDDQHLEVTPGAVVRLSTSPLVGGFRPSATRLFESVANTFGGSSIAVIMTGMGRDGVNGLRAIRKVGGYVIAQDDASSAVFGMPAAAIAAKVVDITVGLDGIAARLARLIGVKAQTVANAQEQR